MNEPTVSEIAMMAAHLFNPNDNRIGIGRSVKLAFAIWDEAAKQLAERRKKNAKLV